MATLAQWIEGARPRTLPNAVAPIIVGSGAAYGVDGFVLWRALAALGIALLLILGVNYANDYSDGIRGTDTVRTGPLRLVGSGAAKPRQVLFAAVGCLALGGLGGAVVTLLTQQWWLIPFGLFCIAGAWFYTGSKRPYGYAGFGELAVFVFFGLIATLGTVYLQAERISGIDIGCAVAVGCFSSAVLVANNLRDIETDANVGKRTLAVLLGARDTRFLYAALVTIPFFITTLIGLRNSAALAGFVAILLVILPIRIVLRGGTGRALVGVLRDTGLALLVWSVATGVALALG
ncbi:1,4-dihydroxy-2-naphthoate polyprenyltransferase [Actinoalloteichus sp. AHMU CJ021]|uniref:1,4-dihydroxy-2-naphthoate octaprenyltransferase n=1 Tax=Actinoalloteichus caeruleus DSM 43889 TaxID=1120930 RepID=A0ABT1JMI7_ACTCY|nr:1,4-dihydroxy-2-naphthoate polyprenyltransferase [Actinoalloteichus caeruleus]AUS79101.1 1,4-dihydroxy-2-naphthoate polyprenyltransferase [Actinoalloteichus sp. AHMU CJ021]MCP2333346.1 1,4-dihydroxy-2-naphthoate prenyltransferase [Actinoalloteichus caeruleus DSM 43889]